MTTFVSTPSPPCPRPLSFHTPFSSWPETRGPASAPPAPQSPTIQSPAFDNGKVHRCTDGCCEFISTTFVPYEPMTTVADLKFPR